MTSQRIFEQVRRYYDDKLARHGATFKGVDWNSEESQRLRFGELSRLFDEDPGASVLDYGCGYGALARYLVQDRGRSGAYVGFDISEQMIAAARVECPWPSCAFSSRREELGAADYAVASGIFNVKGPAGDDEWRAYVLATIDDLASLGRCGFAFNALSTYSDPARRRADLYYADPRELFDHCMRRVSRFVSLLHDSPLYEFTLLVRH